MLATPEIVDTDERETAVVRLTVPRREMPKVFGPAVGEVMSALARQGIDAVSPVFAHHLRMSPGVFDVEVGMAVASRVETAGRVTPGRLPATTMARAVYSGPYEGLAAAWGEFEAWMRANGHEGAEDLWEVYRVGPQSASDPADWRTELNRPLAKQ